MFSAARAPAALPSNVVRSIGDVVLDRLRRVPVRADRERLRLAAGARRRRTPRRTRRRRPSAPRSARRAAARPTCPSADRTDASGVGTLGPAASPVRRNEPLTSQPWFVTSRDVGASADRLRRAHVLAERAERLVVVEDRGRDARAVAARHRGRRGAADAGVREVRLAACRRPERRQRARLLRRPTPPIWKPKPFSAVVGVAAVRNG